MKQLHTCIYNSVELQNCIHALWFLRVIPDFPRIYPIQVTATLWKFVFNENIQYPMHLICTGFSKFSIAWNLRNWPSSSEGNQCIFTMLPLLLSRILVSSLGEIGSVVQEQWYLKVVNAFSLCCYHLPSENGVAFHLKKLEFSLPKNALCQVLLKLAQYFWRRWKC